jgi:predicted anti-sigma-YlaC factor YlaD
MANYNHQPFNDWLLDGAPLEEHEQRTLQEHLQTCEACRDLAVSLDEIDRQLRSAPIAAPAAGFSLRWQERRRAEETRMLSKQRRQTLTTLLFSVGGAMALFALLALALLPLLRTPQPVLLAGLIQLTQLYTRASSLGGTAGTLLRVAFGIIPPSMWIAISVAFGGLCAVWLVALHRFASPRREIL